MIRLIAAIDSKRGIAKKGAMPWKIPEDERYFTRQTKTYGGHVLTGASTFWTGYHGKALVNRHNYVLTRKKVNIPGATVVHDLGKLLGEFKNKDLWVAGGAEVFAEVMAAGKADELYLTHIDADFDCDQFFPEYEQAFKPARQSKPHTQNGLTFTYAVYSKKTA